MQARPTINFHTNQYKIDDQFASPMIDFHQLDTPGILDILKKELPGLLQGILIGDHSPGIWAHSLGI